MTNTIESRIKTLREAKGWKHSELAARVGVHYSLVSMWESGRRSPNSTNLIRLADAFGVTADFLLGRKA